ncbi:unnamed protein product [Ectocarpus sp. 12 AP-2014]
MRCRGYVGFVAPPCDSSCEHGENNGCEIEGTQARATTSNLRVVVGLTSGFRGNLVAIFERRGFGGQGIELLRTFACHVQHANEPSRTIGVMVCVARCTHTAHAAAACTQTRRSPLAFPRRKVLYNLFCRDHRSERRSEIRVRLPDRLPDNGFALVYCCRTRVFLGDLDHRVGWVRLQGVSQR